MTQVYSYDQLIASDRCVDNNRLHHFSFLSNFVVLLLLLFLPTATVTDVTSYRYGSTHWDASLQPTSSFWSSCRPTQMSLDGYRVPSAVRPCSAPSVPRRSLLQHLIALGTTQEKTATILMRTAATSGTTQHDRWHHCHLQESVLANNWHGVYMGWSSPQPVSDYRSAWRSPPTVAATSCGDDRSWKQNRQPVSATTGKIINNEHQSQRNIPQRAMIGQ